VCAKGRSFWISARQMKRLRRKRKSEVLGEWFTAIGASRPGIRRLGKLKQVIALARGHYQGLNDTHLTRETQGKRED
jgi:hypothetical protein